MFIRLRVTGVLELISAVIGQKGGVHPGQILGPIETQPLKCTNKGNLESQNISAALKIPKQSGLHNSQMEMWRRDQKDNITVAFHRPWLYGRVAQQKPSDSVMRLTPVWKIFPRKPC